MVRKMRGDGCDSSFGTVLNLTTRERAVHRTIPTFKSNFIVCYRIMIQDFDLQKILESTVLSFSPETKSSSKNLKTLRFYFHI